MKRLILILMLFFAFAVVATDSQATPQWYKAEVVSVGMVNQNNLLIRLTHVSGSPAFTNMWFSYTGAAVKEFLAAGLTAVSAGLKVSVNADTATGNLIFLYVRND